MSLSLERLRSGPGGAAPALLGIALAGLLIAQGCTPSPYDTGAAGRESPAVTRGKANELPPAPAVGRQAPDFTLRDLEGRQVRLSEFRGKVVFINFWATWCPPCRAEMPEIEAFYQEYKAKGVVVIGIDLFEPEDTVRQSVQRGGYSWTFVIDTTGEVTRNYKVTAIPASFFVNREGIIRAVKIGALTKRDMEARLADAMR